MQYAYRFGGSVGERNNKNNGFNNARNGDRWEVDVVTQVFPNTQTSGWPRLTLWLSIVLFTAFLGNVAVQRYLPGLWEISVAYEAMLLTLATASFVTACLGYEKRKKAP